LGAKMYIHLAVGGKWRWRRCWRRERSGLSCIPPSGPRYSRQHVQPFLSPHHCRHAVARPQFRHHAETECRACDSSVRHPRASYYCRTDQIWNLKRTCLHEPSLSQRERAILRELQDRGDIYILPANSGNAMVILDSQYYTLKINNRITIPIYKIATCVLIEQVYMQANNLIQQCSVWDVSQELLIAMHTRTSTTFRKSTSWTSSYDPLVGITGSQTH
jgi:hypothetical protein